MFEKKQHCLKAHVQSTNESQAKYKKMEQGVIKPNLIKVRPSQKTKFKGQEPKRPTINPPTVNRHVRDEFTITWIHSQQMVHRTLTWVKKFM